MKEVPRRLKKFIDWNKVLSNTSCVVRGEDARTRIGSDVCKKTIDQRVYAIKKAYRNSANNFSLGECLQRWKMSAKKTKSFGGKIVHRKKKSAVLNCASVEQKIYKSFGEKKSCIVPFLFSYQTSRIYFVLTLEPVQIRRIFFPLGNPPYAKKSKREPTFWLVTRPFSQRQICSLFWLILNSRH